MKLKIVASLMSLFYFCPCIPVYSQSSQSSFARKVKIVGNSNSVKIQAYLKPGDNRDSVVLSFILANTASFDYEKISTKTKNNIASWQLIVTEPILISPMGIMPSLMGNSSWFGEPGDNITIKYVYDSLVFSGKGAKKYQLQYEMDNVKQLLAKPANPRSYITNSVDDYFEWNRYLNKKWAVSLALIESYKNDISDTVYQYLKSKISNATVYERSMKIVGLMNQREKLALTNKDLCDIYDSTFNTGAETWMQVAEIGSNETMFIKVKTYRQLNFDESNPVLNDKATRRILYYQTGRNTYKGMIREKFCARFLTSELMKWLNVSPEIESLFADYYNESAYPEYKSYVKDIEIKSKWLNTAAIAPDFSLTNPEGTRFEKKDIKGKISFIDFWFTGCKGCIQMSEAMKRVEKNFENDPNVAFLNISIDRKKEQWLKSVTQGKYTTGHGINLYTEGLGADHRMIKVYNITGYPTIYLLDGAGRIVLNPLPDPRSDSGKHLISLIQHQLVRMHDGPYIIEENGITQEFSIYGNTVTSDSIRHSFKKELSVQTDRFGSTFGVPLKNEHVAEPSEFPKPQKLFVLSDIEGNFDALRELLQANQVIDEQYNWVFGKGHLVFNGDMFDRGDQVTECLWLMYSLEEKAKKAGGYVHFIIGNHEIMNLNGDHRYTIDKYLDNAKLLGKKYADLYGPNTELGKWLRSKNIIEKIGDLLFTHGGISQEINEMSHSIQQMNNLARSYYDKGGAALKSENKDLTLLFNEKLSPFWYRNYYLNESIKTYTNGDTAFKTPGSVVSNVLKRFRVNHIVNGHTIVRSPGSSPDLIPVSTDYNNKVINTDSMHATENSEALLIEGIKYYRVNRQGKKMLLFDETN